tara:strand:+ start:631 stop:843 length:213 start_codon:yes stop_codon:yes gene_type:complete
MIIDNPNNYPIPLKGIRSNGYVYMNKNGIKSIIKDHSRYHKEDYVCDYVKNTNNCGDIYSEVGLRKSDFL